MWRPPRARARRTPNPARGRKRRWPSFCLDFCRPTQDLDLPKDTSVFTAPATLPQLETLRLCAQPQVRGPTGTPELHAPISSEARADTRCLIAPAIRLDGGTRTHKGCSCRHQDAASIAVRVRAQRDPRSNRRAARWRSTVTRPNLPSSRVHEFVHAHHCCGPCPAWNRQPPCSQAVPGRFSCQIARTAAAAFLRSVRVQVYQVRACLALGLFVATNDWTLGGDLSEINRDK